MPACSEKPPALAQRPVFGDLLGHWRQRLQRERFLPAARTECDAPVGTVLIEEAGSEVFTSRDVARDDMQGAAFADRITAPWTGGEPLEIRAEEGFRIPLPPGIDSERRTYTSGTLVAEAVDGSRLVLDAGNGDPASVTLTVEADGSASAFTVAVGDELQIPCTPSRDGDSREVLPRTFDLGDDFRAYAIASGRDG